MGRILAWLGGNWDRCVHRSGVNGCGDGGELDYMWPATYMHGEFEWIDGWMDGHHFVCWCMRHAWSMRGGCACMNLLIVSPCMRHNIIQNHNSVMWDWQYPT